MFQCTNPIHFLYILFYLIYFLYYSIEESHKIHVQRGECVHEVFYMFLKEECTCY